MRDRRQGEPGQSGERAGPAAAMSVADAKRDAGDAAPGEAAENRVVAEQRQAEDAAGRRDQAGDPDAGLEQRVGDDAGMAAGAEKNQIGAQIPVQIIGSNRISPRSAPSR
jgi:hypothetical protein